MLQRFNENRWRPLAAIMLQMLDIVSSRAALGWLHRHRGCTLKGTKVSDLYDYFKYFLKIPEIFGPPPSYIIVCTTDSQM